MTITTQTADNVLKTAYLDVISNYLDYDANPFFSKIKKTSDNVWGKEIKKLVRIGNPCGVVAGSEDGEFYDTGKTEYKEFVMTLKNLYGNLEISDKAIRASQNKSGAFANILNEEIEELMKNANESFSRMLFGDGCGTVAWVNNINMDGDLYVEEKNLLRKGMKIQISYNRDYLIDDGQVFTVGDFNEDESTFSVTPKVQFRYDENYQDERLYAHVVNSFKNEITGLEALFDSKNFNTIYGLKKDENKELLPMIYEYNNKSANENLIQSVIDELKDKYGSDVNMILCSSGVKRGFIKEMATYKRNIDTVELKGGYKTVSYNGIPIISNKYCPSKTMYLLNTDDFAIHQLCDWEWLEGENGNILRQLPNKPVYRATLVKYAELLCSRPWAQAKITNLAED